MEETQFKLVPKDSEQARAKKGNNEELSPYSCLISTLADDEADYNYWNRAFWLEFPKKVIKEAKGKVVLRAIALGSDHAGSKAGSWQGLDNVVRVAQCLIPDSPLAEELLEAELRKFSDGTWISNRKGKMASPSTSGWECGDTYRVYFCNYNPNTNLAYNCMISEPICAYWIYVEDDPIGGGGGSGFPGDDPGECDPTVFRECFGGQAPGGGQPPPEPPDPCTFQNPPDYCLTPTLCLGNPVPALAVTPSNGWNVRGGLYGWTRKNTDGSSRFHDGIDISAAVNSNLFSMHEGTVVAVRNTFAAGEFRRNSYGNLITVQSIINGQVVRLTYAHLNNVNVTVGQAVYAGQIIGKTGDTGNAQTMGDTIVLPHVHVKASTLGLNHQEIKANPNNYMATKFNSDGTVNTATSTCNQ